MVLYIKTHTPFCVHLQYNLLIVCYCEEYLRGKSCSGRLGDTNGASDTSGTLVLLLSPHALSLPYQQPSRSVTVPTHFLPTLPTALSGEQI